jgi:hypothetical protein
MEDQRRSATPLPAALDACVHQRNPSCETETYAEPTRFTTKAPEVLGFSTDQKPKPAKPAKPKPGFTRVEAGVYSGPGVGGSRGVEAVPGARRKVK